MSDLRAVVVNCTLKRSPERSHTQGLIDVSTHIMRTNGVEVDEVRAIDHDIEDALRAGVIGEDDLPAGDVAVLGGTTSERLATLVTDVVAASAGGDRIRQSEEVGAAFLRLRRFMFQNVYLAPPASHEAERARGVVRSLFRWYLEHPAMLPPSEEPDAVTRVTDFVAGMTDRYALRTYRDIFEPKEGPL